MAPNALRGLSNCGDLSSQGQDRLRLSTRPGYYPSLDALRGIAVLAVMLYHWPHSRRVPRGGYVLHPERIFDHEFAPARASRNRYDLIPKLLRPSCSATPARAPRVRRGVERLSPHAGSVGLLGHWGVVYPCRLPVRRYMGWSLWIALVNLRPCMVSIDSGEVLLHLASHRRAADQQGSTSSAHHRRPCLRGTHQPDMAPEPCPEWRIRASHLRGHRRPRRWIARRGRRSLSSGVCAQIERADRLR